MRRRRRRILLPCFANAKPLPEAGNNNYLGSECDHLPKAGNIYIGIHPMRSARPYLGNVARLIRRRRISLKRDNHLPFYFINLWLTSYRHRYCTYLYYCTLHASSPCVIWRRCVTLFIYTSAFNTTSELLQPGRHRLIRLLASHLASASSVGFRV